MSGTKPVRVERVRNKIVVHPNGEAKLSHNSGNGTDYTVDMFFPNSDGETTRILRSRDASGHDVGEGLSVAKQSHYLTLYVKAHPGKQRSKVIKSIEHAVEKMGANLATVQAGFRDGDIECHRRNPKTGKEHAHTLFTCGKHNSVPIWISVSLSSYDTAAHWFAQSSKWYWVDQDSRLTQYGACAGIGKSVVPSTGTTAHIQSRVVHTLVVDDGELTDAELLVKGGEYRKPRPASAAAKKRRRDTGKAVAKELRARIYDASIGETPMQKRACMASQNQRMRHPYREKFLALAPWTEWKEPSAGHTGFIG